MKRLGTIVFLCGLFLAPAYADEVTIPYRLSFSICSPGTYTGEVLNGIPEGHGKYVCSAAITDGTFSMEYSGEWEKGLPQGQGIAHFANTSAGVRQIHSGEFLRGKLHGIGAITTYGPGESFNKFVGRVFISLPRLGVKYDRDGKIIATIVGGDDGTYIGETFEGIPHGRGTFTCCVPEGDDYEYVGEFRDGMYHGQGTETFANGGKYIGDWENDQKHGQGTYVFPNGANYIGEWAEDKKIGHGTYTFPSGENYVGDWKDDKMDGQGKYTYANGSTYVGEYKNDLKHGHGTYTFPDSENYVGAWKGGKRHGHGTYTFPDGATYVGEYKNDRRHGHGTYTFPSGTSYVGEFKDDKRNGQGAYTDATGWTYVGEWRGDKKNGHGTYTASSGWTYIGNWNDGVENGYGTRHYVDGAKYAGDWQDGKRDGQGVFTLPDGSKYVGEWKDDLENGQGTLILAEGLKYVGESKNGVFDGHGTMVHPDGSVYTGEWKDDKPHGKGVFTDESGRVFSGDWIEGDYCPQCKLDWDAAYAARKRGDDLEAIKFLLPYAESGDSHAQFNIGVSYYDLEDHTESVKWLYKAAEQGDGNAQFNLAYMHLKGEGVRQNYTLAIKWYEQALLRGIGEAAWRLSYLHLKGLGVPKDDVMAYAYRSVAATLGVKGAKDYFDLDEKYKQIVGRSSFPEFVIAQGQSISREIWASIEAYKYGQPGAAPDASAESAISTGSGFFINTKGNIVTNSHVVSDCDEIHSIVGNERVTSFIVTNDVKNDIAVLKTAMEPMSIAYFRSGRGIRAGEEILAFGYPLQSVLSDELKGTKGLVNALSGMNNDTRMMQISAPVQPGNSGGPLVDTAGNVVGIVTAKMDAIMMAQLTDDIAQNVNFALKASLVRDLLERKDIDYETDLSKNELKTVNIFEKAKKFTVLIECLQ